MSELRDLLQDNLNIEFRAAVLSNPRKKDGPVKVKVRPLLKKQQLMFQFEMFQNCQAFHRNVDAREACRLLEEHMENMRQMHMETAGTVYTVLVSKKGRVTVKKKAQENREKEVDMSHNRKKRYILEEGVPVPFLKDLGVMTTEGRVVNSKFDKFRQINRFLEFIEDILPELDRDRELTILDFGCGKSYLTFAMYYYLHELKGYDIRVIGLDLKKDVIGHCNELGQKYGYEKLRFLEGNIADYKGADRVDMVVTLHACDTATDYALLKAVRWNVKVILSVPCCQHEVNRQICNKELASVLRYGIIKERMSALITDAVRAELLEAQGYETSILEFIDMEHTPKNLLIRAVRRSAKEAGKMQQRMEEVIRLAEYLQIEPTLLKLLAKGDEGRV